MTTQTAFFPTSSSTYNNGITREKAEDILHKKLMPEWRSQAGNVIEVLQERSGLMQDRVAKSAALSWALDEAPGGAGRVTLNVGDTSLRVHNNALQQASSLAEIPAAYVSTLAASDPDLLVHNLNKRFQSRGPTRQLVRSVGGQALAVLSDKYRRLDSRPILDRLAGTARKLGLQPMGGVATDLQFRLRLAQPIVHEVLPGEFVMFGLNWSNSDVGRGAHDISSFILRVVCNNGAVMESAMRQIHLGRRMQEDGILSDATLLLDTQAAASAVEDVVRAYLEPAKMEERLTAVRMAAAKDVTPATVEGFLKKHLSKEAVAKAKETYLSADVEMLPAGNSAWRLSNALSWLANDETVDADTRLDYQELAGKALNV